MTESELARSWRGAVTGELCWLDADGRPAALSVIPLSDAGQPCVALPYAQEARIAGLREAGEVAFVVSDSRSLRADQPALVGFGGVTVVDDVEGERFSDGLLEVELRKYPPSRALADSPLLRREHWWWLPRVLVRLRGATRVDELAARTNPARHAVLVRGGAAGLTVDTVDIAEWAEPRIRLTALAGGELDARDEPGLLFGYDYSMPDLERWESWTARGWAHGAEFAVDGLTGSPEVNLGPLRLRERMRRQRDLAKSCQRALGDRVL
ncbi:hypothetical protein EV191_106140 [Tamaricihabitans halophyticus]|uniref:Uncharacterized protein n=1 Tax=Tamaricihabitans halophyticus TaxID=1262583 RepID=A0A4V2STT5_9PSEU|nr:hypothetical protein [Tamaricihabitans halophyticus]TCP51976.1 hypothetical protein EV191_106140 [Tamaricihabitans halophyticus]